MKQILTVILLGVMLFSLSGCQSSSASETSSTDESSIKPAPPTTATSTGKKVLVAYFSYSGNTRNIAHQISATLQGDLFEIQTVNPYPKDYDDCVAQAKEELRSNARPQLTNKVTNMDDYDTIFIGYPNWWGTMPMAMFTFLEEYNFSGKTIIPFCTHEGSRMGRSETDLAKLVPNASLQKGLAIRGSNVSSASRDINSWLKALGMN